MLNSPRLRKGWSPDENATIFWNDSRGLRHAMKIPQTSLCPSDILTMMPVSLVIICGGLVWRKLLISYCHLGQEGSYRFRTMTGISVSPYKLLMHSGLDGLYTFVGPLRSVSSPLVIYFSHFLSTRQHQPAPQAGHSVKSASGRKNTSVASIELFRFRFRQMNLLPGYRSAYRWLHQPLHRHRVLN